MSSSGVYLKATNCFLFRFHKLISTSAKQMDGGRSKVWVKLQYNKFDISSWLSTISSIVLPGLLPKLKISASWELL